MTLDQFYAICDAIVPDEYGCHQWSGIKVKAIKGYHYRVTVGFKGPKVYVNRVALERKLGRPIKPGFDALHHCDCGSCVNPDHLYEGTDKDNMRDRVQRNPESFDSSRSERQKQHLGLIRKAANEALKKKYQEDPEFRAKVLVNLEKANEVLDRKWQARAE